MFATSSPALSSSLSSSRSSLRKTNTSIMYTKKTKKISSSSSSQKQKQRRNVVVVLAEAAESNNDNNSHNNEEKQCTGGSCDSCGVAREKMQCDGTGRIQGGLAAIPLFSWWPIKAYRPCPGLIESGGTYTRKGQDVDSILWGENGRD